MTLFYEEIIKLKENYPSIHKKSIKGNFSVWTSDNNIFGKLEAANVIKILLTEMLIKIKETNEASCTSCNVLVQIFT